MYASHWQLAGEPGAPGAERRRGQPVRPSALRCGASGRRARAPALHEAGDLARRAPPRRRSGASPPRRAPGAAARGRRTASPGRAARRAPPARDAVEPARGRPPPARARLPRRRSALASVARPPTGPRSAAAKMRERPAVGLVGSLAQRERPPPRVQRGAAEPARRPCAGSYGFTSQYSNQVARARPTRAVADRHVVEQQRVVAERRVHVLADREPAPAVRGASSPVPKTRSVRAPGGRSG